MSPPFVSIVNDNPAGVPSFKGLQERHMIPYVPEIFKEIDLASRQIVINPPKGLLQLGRQQLLLEIIRPQILVRCGFLTSDMIFSSSLSELLVI